MLEALVASILNRFLKNYVSNLNYDQLKIGIWNGKVNLRDLKLRKDALDKLDLPINVSEGYLGELTLIIPWSNLRSEPVKVIIDHVYLLAEPKNEATVTVKEEEQRAQDLKRRRLETAEMLNAPEAAQHADSKGKDGEGDGFIAQLTTKIIDNLQFTMKNIHIRYEDKVSDPGRPFAVGITLKELSALSTDDQWQPTFISESTKTINKLATLESLSVYWNTDTKSLAGMHHEEASEVFTSSIPTSKNLLKEHQYILRPVSSTGKIKLNKNYGDKIPKLDVKLSFDELAFSLDNHQYQDAILMIDLFHANLKKHKYLKFHPEKGKTPKSHPREYFQFAAKAILSEIHERNHKWTWDHFKTRRDQRLQYIGCYVADKMKQATSEQTASLKGLEHDLSLEDIRFYRSIAKSKIRREKIKIDKINEKKKADDAKAGWWGWLGGGSNSKADKDDAAAVDENADSIHMTEEQKQELYQAIEYDEDKTNIASAVDVPMDTIKFALNTKLNRGSFTLKQNVKKPNETELLSIVFDAVSFDATKYIESMKVEAALGDLQLYDGSTKDTIYHKLIGVKKENSLESSLLDVKYNMKELERRLSNVITDSENTKNAEPFFSVVFEKKPLNKKADNAISLKMRHLEIIYSPIVISGVLEFFKPPSSKMESINALIAVAGDTFEGLKVQTRAGLEYALETHTTLDLNVDMDAPIIIIPESLTSQDSPVMIIDAGHINVDSQLADKNEIHDIKNKDIRNYSAQDTKILEDLMYDKFNLQLTQTKVLIGTNTEECLWQLQDKAPVNGIDARFVERIDMNFLIEMCILPGKTEFTKFKVSGHLPLLSINLSDVKYKTLMKIVDFIVPKTNSDDELETVTNRPQLQNPRKSGGDNIISEHFWGHQENEDLLLSDTESETTRLGSRSSSPVPSDRASIGVSDLQQFKLVFQVDKVYAAIHETSATDRTKETLLCEVLLRNFELTVITRPNDLLVDISLKALSVIDKMEKDNEFKYLVTSDIIDKKHANSHSNDKNLVDVKYRKASRAHPHFNDVYNGFDSTVDVVLSTLTVIVTRNSILRIYNWIMNTFTSPPALSADIETTAEEIDGDVYYEDVSSIGQSSVMSGHHSLHKIKKAIQKPTLEPATNDNRMKVAIHLDSVNLILNNDGLRLGTGQLSVGDLIVVLEPKTIRVTGKFANFTLSDDTIIAANNNAGSSASLNSTTASETFIVSIVGDELADFTYRTYDPKEHGFPGYNQKFDLRMGAIQLFINDSVKPTLTFLSEFLEMKSVYDAARNAAVETAQQYQEVGNRFHFDVMIKSPVVIFPIGENKKTDTLIAHLGEIRAKNSFTQSQRINLYNIPETVLIPMAHITCGLYDINLRSTAITYDEAGAQIKTVLPIIDDLDIKFDIESPENSKENAGSGSQIIGNVSDVRMALTERQYKSLLETWEYIQKNFLATPPPDEKLSKGITKQPQDNTDLEHIEIIPTSPTPSHSSVSSVINNIDSSHVGAVTKSLKPKVTLDLVIILNTVYLEVMNGDHIDLNNKEEHKLSKLAFDGISLKLQNMSDESMLMEVKMQSISFADTRAQSKSKFREILPANSLDGPQFQFRLSSYKDNGIPIMDMKVTVDSPKIVLSLDYLFLLKDFFMSPFIVIEPTEAQKFAQTHGSNVEAKKTEETKQLQSQNQAPPTVIKYNVNVIDLQVLCIAAPENSASEAIILSFSQLTVVQATDLEINLDGIGMVLCRMDNIKESTMHFVEEFSVCLKMETASAGSVHNLTSIKLNVENVILRLSYQDAMLISTIATKVMALMNTEDSRTEAPKPVIDDIDSSSSDDGSSEIVLDRGSSSEYLNVPGATTDILPKKPKGIEPFIVMSKESLFASFEGLQIILIEDLHDLPFMDIQINPFAVSVSDWSRSIQADVDILIKANNFNFKNSHWEPIIEPWDFCIKVSQDVTDKSTSIVLESKSLMFLNVTHAFVESLLTLSQTLSDIKPLAETAQSQVKPYHIRNFTGHDLQFWNMSDDAETFGTQVYKLKDGETMPWTFRDWKKRREKINIGNNLFGVQIDKYDWEPIRHIPVDRESERAYRLRPTVNDVNHRVIVDIHLENHIKTVTFRSGLVIENKALKNLQVAVVDENRNLLSSVIKIESHESYNVPIDLSYSDLIVVRPSEEFQWSKQKLKWSDIMLPNSPKSIECPPVDGADSEISSIYQINVDLDKKNPLVKQYPFMKVQLYAPIEIENLMPYDFDLFMTNDLTGERVTVFIEKGSTAQINSMRSDSVLAIQVDLKSDRYKTSETATIKTTPNYSSIGEKLIINDHDDVPTNLRMNISRASSTTDSLRISIYAPYLILNKTGLDVSLRPKHKYRHGKVPAEAIPGYSEGQRICPVIFSYTEFDHHNRAQISIDDSKWSEPISFEALGSTQDVTLFSKSDPHAKHAGIMVEEGIENLRLTKIVTIMPRYILKNNMNIRLKFCEFGSEDTSTNLDPNQKLPLYQTSKSDARWLSIQLQELDNNWSAPVDILEIGKTYVKVDKGDRNTIPYLVRVSVYIQDATIFVSFNEDEDWPYFIVNLSSTEIQIRQESLDFEDYELKESQKKSFKEPRTFTLAPGNKIKYSWDIPVAKEKRLELLVGNRRRSVNFQAIGSQVPFRYMKHRDGPIGSNTLSIDIVADESALVLRLYDFDLSKSVYRPKSSGTSTLASTSREGSLRDAFETVTVQHVTNYVVELNLAGFGISIINRNALELANASIKGFDFKYTDSNMYQSLRLSIQWLQIDNQAYNSTYPILCYPTSLPKVSSELAIHPTLHVALVKVKDDRHGVFYFKLFSILLQEMTFEVDEEFIYGLLDFVQFENSQAATIEADKFTMIIPEPVVDKTEALLYFEEFCIQPMRLNLSFVRSEKKDDKESAENVGIRSSAVGYVFNVFTMTLGNINDAPIKLNALIVENLRASSADLSARIMLHYRDQVIYQVHRVVGSIDILGNPVGLFNTLSSGFGELFYEPYQGFIMSDRPQDLGIGIAKGVGGFMKKSVFGITDSMSKFTGSLSKGVSAATMDKKFQDRRRMNITRNKPTHAIYGITQGVGYFGTSVASGFAGLVKRPMEGAETGGVGGFVGGLGRGIVGVFTKPVVGFLDMASNITAGIRETTTVFEAGDISRERLPRYSGKDGIVVPYSQREALGQMWLKEMESGRFFNEVYAAHTVVNNDATIAILTYQRVIVILSDTLKLEWTIPLSILESVDSGVDGVYLRLKRNAGITATKVLSIEEETSRTWFTGAIAEALRQLNEEKERQ